MSRMAIGIVCFLLFASTANAETLVEKYGRMVPDNAVQVEVTLALKSLGKVNCVSNTPCTPATEEEFTKWPITMEDGRAAMAHAIISSLAQWCGLDWKRSFLPMIAFGKRQKGMDDRQLMLMTLVHGDFQKRQFAYYSGHGQCPSNQHDLLDAQLPKIPS